MNHFAAAVQCPKCGHSFAVCVHTDRQPHARRSYTVRCPSNNSPVGISGETVRAVETCPPGAILIREAAG